MKIYKPQKEKKPRNKQETFGLPDFYAKYLSELLERYPHIKRAEYLRDQLIHHLDQVMAEESEERRNNPLNRSYGREIAK